MSMAATTTIRRRRTKAQEHPKIQNQTAAIDHAVPVIYRVCCLAGSASLIDKILRVPLCGVWSHEAPDGTP